MMWGCLLADRVGDLYQVDGIMKKEDYHSILQRHAVPSGLNLYGEGFVMQQDNDPKHTSLLCRRYLQSKEEQGVLKILEWPSQSPDLNPIELLWEEMNRQIIKKKVSNPKIQKPGSLMIFSHLYYLVFLNTTNSSYCLTVLLHFSSSSSSNTK